MTSEGELFQQLHEWTTGLREDSLSPASFARLEALISTNVLARLRYLEIMSQHASLRRLAIGAEVVHVSSNVSVANPEAANPQLRSSIHVPILATIANCSWASTLAVALIFYGCFALVVWNLRPEPNKRPPFADPDLQGIARIESSREVVGKLNDVTNWRPDAPIRHGDVLKLTSGIVQVTFGNGAAVAVEGPAEFVVENEGRASLRRGRVTAIVPHSAAGFTIVTPHTQVVDLGTEFGVEVDANGNSEVHVFVGKVEVRAGESTTTIVANNANRFLEGNAQRIAVDRQKFGALQSHPMQADKERDYELTIQGDHPLLDWNRPEVWGGAAPHSRGNYHVGRTSFQVLRTAKDAQLNSFPGVLTIHSLGKLACKYPGLAIFRRVVLDGGKLLLAGNELNEKQDIGGELVIAGPSTFELLDRKTEFVGQLSGDSELAVQGPGTLRLTGSGSRFRGSWVLRGARVEAMTLDSLGSGPIELEPNSRLELHYELRTNSTISLSKKAVLVPHRKLTLGGLIVDGQPVKPGRHVLKNLQNTFRGYFDGADPTVVIEVLPGS